MHQKPSFAKCAADREQFRQLKEVVRRHAVRSRSDKTESRIKCFLLPAAYAGCWYAAMNFATQPISYLVFFGLMGIVMALIFINVVHDACHATLFGRKWQNRLAAYLLDCLGANSFIWSARHLRMHHNYPNTIGWDCDIEQGGPLKIFPSESANRIQKTQHYWIFVMYPLFLLNWLLVRDFRDFYSKGRYIRKVCEIPAVEHIKLWLFKLAFAGYVVLIPIRVFDVPTPLAIGGLFAQMICGSLVGMVILLTPHVNSGNTFPVPSHRRLGGWLRHQFETTNDIDGNNFVTRHLMNHFNWHLAHHLFPDLTPAEAASATPHIRKFAQANGLPYKSHSLFGALRLHYRLIKSNALEPKHIFEEDL